MKIEQTSRAALSDKFVEEFGQGAKNALSELLKSVSSYEKAHGTRVEVNFSARFGRSNTIELRDPRNTLDQESLDASKYTGTGKAQFETKKETWQIELAPTPRGTLVGSVWRLPDEKKDSSDHIGKKNLDILDARESQAVLWSVLNEFHVWADESLMAIGYHFDPPKCIENGKELISKFWRYQQNDKAEAIERLERSVQPWGERPKSELESFVVTCLNLGDMTPKDVLVIIATPALRELCFGNDINDALRVFDHALKVVGFSSDQDGLFKKSSGNEGLISYIWGAPDPEIFPVKEIVETIAKHLKFSQLDAGSQTVQKFISLVEAATPKYLEVQEAKDIVVSLDPKYNATELELTRADRSIISGISGGTELRRTECEDLVRSLIYAAAVNKKTLGEQGLPLSQYTSGREHKSWENFIRATSYYHLDRDVGSNGETPDEAVKRFARVFDRGSLKTSDMKFNAKFVAELRRRLKNCEDCGPLLEALID